MKLFYIDFFVFFILLNNLLGAAYEDLGMVRAMGMGEAFEAMSVGIESIRYNPAGSAYLKSLQVYSGFGKPALGFDDESSMNSLDFGIAVPFCNKPYLFFLNYLFKGLTLGNENKIIRDGAFSFIFHQFTVADFTYERLFTFNIAKSLNNLFEGANLALGANVNIFNRGFTPNEDTLSHPDSNLVDSTTGLGLDLGATYDFSRFIRIGFVLANLLQPNISFFKDGEEKVNQQLKLGFVYRLGDIFYMQDLITSFDLMQISRDADDIRKPETVYKMGLEFWEWQRQLGFRFGYKTTYNILTTGFSFKYKFKNGHSSMINYAFNYPLDSKTYKHYFSLNYEFEFSDYLFDYTTDKEVEDENQWIQDNYRKGMVIVRYKTLPNDNLFNISLIHYGSPDRVNLLKEHNKIQDEKNLPVMIEVPYDAKSFELYKVQSGDSSESIAQKFYGTTKETGKIKRFNTIEFSRLKPGRLLIIPITSQEKEQIKLKNDALEKLQKANQDRNLQYEKLVNDSKSKIETLINPLLIEYKNSEVPIKDINNEIKQLEKKIEKEKDPTKKDKYSESLMDLTDKKTSIMNSINSKIKNGSMEIEKVKQSALKSKDETDKKWLDIKNQNISKAGTDFVETPSMDLMNELNTIKLPLEEIKETTPVPQKPITQKTNTKAIVPIPTPQKPLTQKTNTKVITPIPAQKTNTKATTPPVQKPTTQKTNFKAPATTIPATTQTAQEYVVASGDNWSKIAKKLLGDANKYKLIMDYNGITDPNKLQVGQKLKIPPAQSK